MKNLQSRCRFSEDIPPCFFLINTFVFFLTNDLGIEQHCVNWNSLKSSCYPKLRARLLNPAAFDSIRTHGTSHSLRTYVGMHVHTYTYCTWTKPESLIRKKTVSTYVLLPPSILSQWLYRLVSGRIHRQPSFVVFARHIQRIAATSLTSQRCRSWNLKSVSNRAGKR